MTDNGRCIVVDVPFDSYELRDGETAVAACPSLAPAIPDFAERSASHVLAGLADRAGDRLARALDRLRHVGLATYAVGHT